MTQYLMTMYIENDQGQVEFKEYQLSSMKKVTRLLNQFNSDTGYNLVSVQIDIFKLENEERMVK